MFGENLFFTLKVIRVLYGFFFWRLKLSDSTKLKVSCWFNHSSNVDGPTGWLQDDVSILGKRSIYGGWSFPRWLRFEF